VEGPEKTRFFQHIAGKSLVPTNITEPNHKISAISGDDLESSYLF